MTTNTQILRQDSTDYLFKDITEKLIGASFRVYNVLGYGLREKEYQRAFVTELGSLDLKFKR